MKLFFIITLLLSLNTAHAAATSTSFRYEGVINGPGVSGVQTGQTFTVTLERPDGCGANLGVSAWNSGSVTMTDGQFTLNPLFQSDLFAKAMDPWNTFSGACPSIPYYQRRLKISWNSEAFYVNLEDAPRANLANYATSASDSSAIGSVAVQPNMTCSSGSVLKYNTGTTRFECLALTLSDIPALSAAQVTGGTFASTQIPSLVGDVSGNIAASSVDKIKGVSIAATAPSTGQVLKFNGTAWAPGADNSNSPVDADYATKGILKVDTNSVVSGLDITGGTLKLATTGVSAGSYGSGTQIPSLTIDSQGRVTAASSIALNDSTKLPLAGGTMTGAINMGTQNITNATSIASTNVSLRNLILNDSGSSTVTVKTPATVPASYNFILPTSAGSNGQVLTTDGTGALSWASPGGGGSVTNVSSANSYITVTSPTSTPTLSLNVGTVANTVAAGNDPRITGAFHHTGDSFGSVAILGTNDLNNLEIRTNSTPRMTISSGGNVGIGTSAPSSALHLNGAQTFTGMPMPGYPSPGTGLIYFDNSTSKFKVSETGTTFQDLVQDSILTSNYYNDIFPAQSCTTLQTPYWNNVTDAWACQNIKLDAPGGLFQDGGNTMGSSVTMGTNDNFGVNFETFGITRMSILSDGRVGIGTTTPNSQFNSYLFTTNSGSVSPNNFDLITSPSANHTGLYSALNASLTMNGSQGINQAFASMVNSNLNGTGAVSENRGLDVNTYKSLSASGTTGMMRGIVSTLQNDGSLVTSATGLHTDVRTGGNGNITDARGIASVLTNNISGTMTNATAIYANIMQSSSIPINNAIGIDLSMSGTNITNAIGLKIGSMGSGASKTAILQNDSTAKNLFAGPMNVGSAISPRATLEVTGAFVGNVATPNVSSMIDFSIGNFQYTTFNCGTFTLKNMKDGGSYIFVVKGLTPSTCNFTAYSDGGSTPLTIRPSLTPFATTSGKQTLFKFYVLGSDAYVEWSSSY